MKKARFIISSIIIVIVFFTNETVYSQTKATNKTESYINQLFVFDSDNLTGALYFTKNGNVIYNFHNEKQDTVEYIWGKYKSTDSTITYQLTDEYYYHGKWDARWDAKDPDYKKGKTRKVKLKEVTLYKTKCSTYPFFSPYSKNELTENGDKASLNKNLSFITYQENKNEKFYHWVYKQIPVLANL